MIDAGDKVAKLWGERARAKHECRECHWTDAPLVKKYHIHPAISGDSERNWFMWVNDEYFTQPVRTALSLGCGDGCLERHGVALGMFDTCEAYDISPDAVAVAEQKAEQAGLDDRLTYEVQDLNTVALEPNRYDAVFAAMSLHHVSNLEHLFDQVHQTLTDGGLFIINEYVGPDRFQWTDLQLEVANQLLALLPETHRIDSASGQLREQVERMTTEHMISTDPSEAVRSSEIVRLIEERFTVLRKVDYGGTLINLALDNITHNFDEQSPSDMAMLQLTFHLESLLIREDVLSSDFCVMVARKNSP